MPQSVKIRLANGSLASQVCKVAQINVSRDINKFNDVHSLYFVVLSGPNNLLGRHSLQCLWPKEYEKLKNVCGQNVVSTHRGSMTMKIPNNGRPTKMSELNVSSSSLNIRKPVDNSKSKISKNIINSVPNASDSNISDGVKTKELDKSYTSSNLARGSTKIYSIDINKGLKSKDCSGEANSNLRAKNHLNFPQLQTADQVRSRFQAPPPSVPNRLNPVYASPHLTPKSCSNRIVAHARVQHVTVSAQAGDDVMSPRRHILLLPKEKHNNIFNKNIVQPYFM